MYTTHGFSHEGFTQIFIRTNESSLTNYRSILAIINKKADLHLTEMHISSFVLFRLSKVTLYIYQVNLMKTM